MLTRQPRGFTLIELMVTLTLLAILLLAAAPAIGNWTANSQVRSAAEALQNALRLAQSEAVRRNRQSVFVLTSAQPGLTAAPADNGTNWYVRALPLVASESVTDYFVEGGTFGTQGGGVTIAGQAMTCFNSLGRQVTNASTGLSATVQCTAPSSTNTPALFNISKSGSNRAMRIQAYLGGKIRMCDPAKSLDSSPDGCCTASQTSGTDC